MPMRFSISQELSRSYYAFQFQARPLLYASKRVRYKSLVNILIIYYDTHLFCIFQWKRIWKKAFKVFLLAYRNKNRFRSSISNNTLVQISWSLLILQEEKILCQRNINSNQPLPPNAIKGWID